ncbi:MAG: S8 family serine peptidase, partial [Bacteroidetes bacterium]|nr:S8 family serine peptidase [Bacteroidota bacterium]
MVCTRFRALGTLLCTLVAFPLNAQSELIVRLEDGYNGPLKTALEEARVVPGAPAALFEDVVSVHRAFSGHVQTGSWTDRVFVLALDDASLTARQLNRWAATPGVRYVQFNGTYDLDIVDDLDDEPFADSLGHLRVIRADEAWEQTTGSASVLIGLVDTGLYMEHPDFVGQVWINPGEIPDNGIDDDGNGFVDDVNGYDFVDRSVNVGSGDYYVRDNDPSEDGTQEHGTLTAGVMSAALGNGAGIAGVAPGARIVPIRAFGRDGVAEDDDLAAAIVYAADLGVDVINLSFGRTEDSPLLHEAIQYAYNQGTVVVASGGNAGGDGAHYPSDYPETIGVAWFTSDGSDIEPVGGQFGPGIDLGAPGTAIFTTLAPHESDPRPIEEQLYGRRSGSSLSAPQVTGAAALLRSIDPTLSPESIRGILTATARDLREPGWDTHTAAGLLDVANALGLPYPTNVSLINPEQDGGAANEMPIVGSTIAPLFASWSVDYATFDPTIIEGDPIGAWTPIVDPVQTQVREDTLGVWNVSGVEEGLYLVRLVVHLANGQTLEDRRRVTIDRSPPVIEVTFAGPAYFDGRQGVLVEVRTDDVTEATLEVERGGGMTAYVAAENREQLHGMFWPNELSEVGMVTARVTVENASGLTASSETTVELDALHLNSALFTETVLDMPSGYFMEKATDFDGDGLPEVVFNRLVDGEPSDSVLIYEWAGENMFVRQRELIARLIPRDEGDTDNDGRRELLFQFGPNTFLAEAGARAADCPGLNNTQACYPNDIDFEDTTPSGSSQRTLWGVKLVDLDGDGIGEIIGHDLRIATPADGAVAVQWRIFERNGSTFTQIAELDNPTGNSDDEEPENVFNDLQGLAGDFDGDGKNEWLSGDYDGDYILYEHTGGHNFSVIWTFETDRYSAGARLVQGDFDGDGINEFWGMTTPKTAGGIDGAAFGLAQGFDSTGDNQFALFQTLAFQSLTTRYGTMAAADFDLDGTDELIVVHSPDLWIFSAANDWKPIFHTGALPGANGPTGLRSIRVVVEDFTGDLVPEILVSGADGQSRLFTYNSTQAGLAPPQWASAYAVDAASVHLSWSTLADSVTVFAATLGQPFNPLATTTDAELNVSATAEQQYVLRAWYGSASSELSAIQQVRPHAPATVNNVVYLAGNYVRLTFTEKLDLQTAPEQFVLGGSIGPSALLFEDNGFSVALQFDDLQAGANTIGWSEVRDAEGTPVGQEEVAIDVPAANAEGTLFLVSWEIMDGSSAKLVFNMALDATQARDISNYRVDPTGQVTSVIFNTANPDAVELTIDGRALGATGLQTTIVVSGLVGAAGATLAPEGNVATLSAFSDDLTDVYVFPNPFRADQHAGRVVIAGLPRTAAIEVYALDGAHVRSLEEFDGDGGTPWDLTDDNGEQVPSGIYLIR